MVLRKNISKEKLKELYTKKRLSTIAIAKIYNCNAETIRRRLIDFRIFRRKYRIEINKKPLYKFYLIERLSTNEISKKYNCSAWTINHRLTKYGIKLRSSTEFLKWRSPGNSIKPNVNISPILSYVLGVLLGDGWTYKYDYTYFIGLDAVKKEFCLEFLNALKQIGLNPKLIYRGKRGWRTISCSKAFFTWFKSLEYNDIKYIAMRYPIQFLKGFHESEGCTFLNKTHKGKYKTPAIIISNTNKNLINLTKELLENLNFHPTLNLRYYPSPYSSCWRINLFRKQEVLRFLDEVRPVIKNLNCLKIS